MLDPKLLRNDLDNTAQRLDRRGFVLDVQTFVKLEEKRKRVQVIAQQFQKERNDNAKAIGQAKAKGEDVAPLMAAVANTGTRLKQTETELESKRYRPN